MLRSIVALAFAATTLSGCVVHTALPDCCYPYPIPNESPQRVYGKSIGKVKVSYRGDGTSACVHNTTLRSCCK